jgi:predicted phosphohydrolase
MAEMFSTIGGVATRDEAYRKLMHHLDESRNQCLVIGHLHNTEDDNQSKLKAKGWYGVEEMLAMMQEQIRQIAMRRAQ